MILDEEVYLEHFGVKGMKWGVRKNPYSGMKLYRDGVRDPRRDKKKKIVRNVAIAAGVTAAGGLAVAAFLKKRGSIPAKSIPKTAYPNFQEAFRATFPTHKESVFYNTYAEEAFRKAGAFGPIPLGPIGSTSVARLRGAIPLPRVK